MEYNISIVLPEKKRIIRAKKGENLLKLLQDHSIPVKAPCGGNGTCGKCRIFVRGEGYVTCCQYYIQKDIEISLPPEREMTILTNQYEHSLVMPLNPGPSAMKSSYPFGLAIDIGTTSIVIYLVNLITGVVHYTQALPNPQSSFGADVISRINYSVSDEKGIENLQKVLIRKLNSEISGLLEKQSVSSDFLNKICIVGNTCMLHNFMAVNALSIALSPFKPVFTEEQKLKAKDIGLEAHPEADVFLAPSISGYVGADIVAGLASLKISFGTKTFLYIDIGTNGEIALVSPDKILSCATAAGPAFEGANISDGMSAFSGAISQYSNDGYQTISNAAPVGICGSGLIDIIAFMINKGIIDENGNITEDFTVVSQDNSGTGKAIKLTQQDIREIQLAKAAISAGISVLLNEAKIKESSLDHIILAGGFGNFLDIGHSIRIGLLPNIEKEKYIQVGNAAGTGAILYLKSLEFIKKMKEIKKRNKYIELSTHPDFTMEYAMRMNFQT